MNNQLISALNTNHCCFVVPLVYFFYLNRYVNDIFAIKIVFAIRF